MISVLYYIIISVLSLFVLYNLLTKKMKFYDLFVLAIILVTFALRALHIK